MRVAFALILAAILFAPARARGGEARSSSTDADPGPGFEAFADAFARAEEKELAAHRLAAANPGEVGDAELVLLLDAIDVSMEIVRASGRGPAYAAAWHRIARCEFRCGRLWPAFEALERSFPEAPPGAPPPDMALVTARVTLQKRIGDALMIQGLRRVRDCRIDGQPANGYQAARKAYRAIVVNDRNHPDAPDAYLRYARCCVKLGDDKAAEEAYRSVFAIDYPGHPVARTARLELAQLYLDRYRAVNQDLPAAIRLEVDDLLRQAGLTADEGRRFRGDIREIVHQAPDIPVDRPDDLRAAEAERDEAEAGELLRQAQAYFNNIKTRSARAAAVNLLRQVIERHPDTRAAEVARSLLDRWRQ